MHALYRLSIYLELESVHNYARIHSHARKLCRMCAVMDVGSVLVYHFRCATHYIALISIVEPFYDNYCLKNKL